ncbi:MAG: PEP/pyruvate-binding domain-containing protein [Candidatus Magasanikbacteria bacterium]
MQHLKFFKNINKTNVDIAGGKGASLGEMINNKIPVPNGFVVLSSAFDRFLEETDLNAEIEARLNEVNPEDTNTIDKASAIIRDTIHDNKMPEDLTKEILEAYDELFANTPSNSPLIGGELSNQFVAVRSSATAEDSDIASWAGELESYLNTTRENVVEKVKNCWSSLFTPRAIFYRHEKGLIDAYVSVAVVVQQMVQSHISGITFTVHPVTEDYNQMIIEAVYGLGEAIVGGLVTPDSYIVHKDDMSIFDINIGHQTRKLIKTRKHTTLRSQNTKTRKHDGDETNFANEWIEIKGEGEKQKLSGKQIIEVAEVCKRIEEHYGFPCDIEWVIDDKGKVFITQSRPITTLKKL